MGEILQATCKDCNHIWNPFGYRRYITPHTANVECPNCKVKLDATWDDLETKKLKRQQELGLVQHNDEFELLKQRLSLLEQKLALEEQKRSTIESELQIIKDWSFHRESDFRRIEDMAKEIEADEKFREEHK